jgi:hypothetical protein
MDEYTVEIDELHDHLVVLAVPALCLLVFGRTLDEAMTRARASIAFRLLDWPPTWPGITLPHPACDARRSASPTAA